MLRLNQQALQQKTLLELGITIPPAFFCAKTSVFMTKPYSVADNAFYKGTYEILSILDPETLQPAREQLPNIEAQAAPPADQRPYLLINRTLKSAIEYFHKELPARIEKNKKLQVIKNSIRAQNNHAIAIICPNELNAFLHCIARANYDEAAEMLQKNPALVFATWTEDAIQAYEMFDEETLKKLGIAVPQDYLCPVAQTLMNNPVFLPSENSIELSTLEQCRGKDPLTGIALPPSFFLIPNTALKNAIGHFKRELPQQVLEALVIQQADNILNAQAAALSAYDASPQEVQGSRYRPGLFPANPAERARAMPEEKNDHKKAKNSYCLIS